MSLREFTPREKINIRVAVGMAVRTGKIVKPDNCEWCDAPGRKWIHGLHGHHEDYAKPLKVIWLCPGCHGARHVDIDMGVSLKRSRASRSGLCCSPGRGNGTEYRDAIHREMMLLNADIFPLPKDEVTAS